MNAGPSTDPLMEDPSALLERALIEDYLREQGYTLEALQGLPERMVKRLMREASRYASLKLEEMEARARFVEEIHVPAPSSRE